MVRGLMLDEWPLEPRGAEGRLYGPLWAAGMVVNLDVDSCEGTSTP